MSKPAVRNSSAWSSQNRPSVGIQGANVVLCDVEQQCTTTTVQTLLRACMYVCKQLTVTVFS